MKFTYRANRARAQHRQTTKQTPKQPQTHQSPQNKKNARDLPPTNPTQTPQTRTKDYRRLNRFAVFVAQPLLRNLDDEPNPQAEHDLFVK